MIESFQQLLSKLKKMPSPRICVAAAEDEDVLRAVREVIDEEIAQVVLVGHQDRIWRIACNIGLNLSGVRLIHETNASRSLLRAIDTVARGEAELLINGQVDVSDYLQAVENEERLKAGQLSYLEAFEVPGYSRLLYVTDCGLHTFPDFKTKMNILRNAVIFLKSLGLEKPRVAVLSANEKINPKMPVTLEARELADSIGREFDGDVLAEGPVALDVAVSKDAARRKGINSALAAGTDLLFVPSLEAGRVIGQVIMHLAKGKMAAVVLGAGKPVLLSTKNQNWNIKFYSLAMACYSVAFSRPFSTSLQ